MKRATVAIGCLFLICLLGAGTLDAQELGFMGVGGRLSFVDPENLGSTIGLGAHADLGQIIQNLKLFPSLEYWSKSPSGSDVSFTHWSINGDVRYYFPTQGTVDFFAGGGLAIAFVSFGSFDDSDVGLNFLGGADFPVSEKVRGTANIKFLASDLTVLKISVGATYILR